MHAPTAAELLGAWERGEGQRPAARGLTLLSIACPDASPDELAALSIGRRDRMLLALREAMFGPDMAALVACTHCGDLLEANFTTRDVRAEDSGIDDVVVKSGAWELRMRLPNSHDLGAVGRRDLADARRLLFERCLLAASVDGRPAGADDLPSDAVDAAAHCLAEADPQADMHLTIPCPACGQATRAPFDVLSFLWTEMEHWSNRVLGDVHVLASAYGWSERDILAMSPARRRAYMDMIGTWPTS